LGSINQKEHTCPKRSSNDDKFTSTISTNYNTVKKSINYNKNYNDNYNYKKSWTFKFDNKQSMDNSLEILHGTAETIRKHYEILSDLIKKYNGKIHGSQSHGLTNNIIQIIVYYEIPEGGREEIREPFEDLIRDN